MEKDYGAAFITCLNRETGEEKNIYLYPVTTILYKKKDGSNQGILIVENGVWVNGKNKFTRLTKKAKFLEDIKP